MIQKILDIEKGKRNEAQRNQLTRYFLIHLNPKSRELFAGSLKQQADLEKGLVDLEKAVPSSLVMQERTEPRQAHVLYRGQYTEKREKVSSQVPAWLGATEENAPANRLGLAQWLVSPTHPLTARVTVNRFWQHYFGTGLVKTSEDFGVQGERPSHPDLLDWLAIEFIESGWDVKRMQKLLVMSATYRQSSRVSQDKLAVDPGNRLLSRGPRHRLDAEVIRDQALAVSGLLKEKVGGPSVKPYQPGGLWADFSFGKITYTRDSGDSLYRRSLYTFWRRSLGPPNMFDEANRPVCNVRLRRTNTPLHALTMLNDITFVEAARVFAERMLTSHKTPGDRLATAFRMTTSRKPGEAERAILQRALERSMTFYRENPEQADAFRQSGEHPPAEGLDAIEVAAYGNVMNMILNTDEALTRE